jgi:hypothetical protein
MRLLPIIAAASIGLFAITDASAQGTSSQPGAGNPSSGQNMDTTTRGNPNTPSAGQTTGMSSKAMTKKKKSKKHSM